MMQRSEREHHKRERSNFILGAARWASSIIADPRQILAGFLTVTMFVMLAHMVRREHFGSNSQVSTTEKTSFELQRPRLEENPAASIGDTDIALWGDDAPEFNPCWKKPTLGGAGQSEGYVTFSLTDGPEYHVSQIADAVAVARGVGATLILPDIRGSKLGDMRDFEDVYDANKFIKSLDGVVRVVKEPSLKLSAKNLAVVKVPNRVSNDYIAELIEPVYHKKGNIRLATYFPSVNMKKLDDMSDVACMAMFGSLELQPEIRGVVDSMIERLRTLSQKSDGHFVAVDLRVDALEKKGCKSDGSASKSCFDPREVGIFLRKIGFSKDTTIYLTQSRWDNSLDALKDYFPKVYTKEKIMPTDKKKQFLDLEAPTLEEVVDFYICSESDVFVPAISGLFYDNVAGKRIASGKTQILVPTDISGTSLSPDQYISPYVAKKKHPAYSCFC